MAAGNDREEVALSLSELDDVLESGGLAEDASAAADDELEQYGVWVKIKPQPIASSEKNAAPAELSDLEAAESPELTEDEQDLLAELESGVAESEEDALEAPEDASEVELEVPALLEGEALTVGEEPSEPFGELSLEETPGQTLDEEIASLDEELAALGEGTREEAPALPELEVEELDLDAAFAEESVSPLEELDVSEAPAEAAPLEPEAEMEAEIDLELPGDEDSAAEEALATLDGDLVLEEPGAIGEPLPSLEEDLVLEAPPVDEDLILEAPDVGEDELILEGPTAEGLILEEPAEEAAVAGLAELEGAEPNEPETPLSERIGQLPDIELEEPTPPRGPHLGTSAEAKPDAAAAILEKIEQELHAIRSEITDLRDELSVLRKERDSIVSAAGPESEEGAAGFFAGDDDETIALTGDELDNILNTADITEEKEPEAGVGAADGLPDVLDEDLGAGTAAEEENVLDEDILERAAEPDILASVSVPEAAEPEDRDLRIPEEELVDASGAEAIADESSLLQSEPLVDLDLTEEEMEAEPPAEEPELSADIAADLAAEAEAAVAEAPPEEPTAPADIDLDLGDIALPEDDFSVDLDIDAELSETPAEEEVPTVDLAEEDVSLEVDTGADAELSGVLDLDLTSEATDQLETDLGELSLHEELPAAEIEQEPLPSEVPTLESGGGDAELEVGVETEEAETPADKAVPDDLRDEIKSVLSYLDQLLEALPDEKIEEFAKSEYFGVYKKLFVELGLEE